MLVRVGDREYQAAEGAIYGIIGESDEFLSRLEDGAISLNLARLQREQKIGELESARRGGKTIFVASHDEAVLERVSDEVWWVEGLEIRERGAAGVVLAKYRAEVAKRLRSAGEGNEATLQPSVRRGDGRASVEKVQLLGEDGMSTAVWRSGELAVIRVSVQFAHPVDDPVIGILIRTRIGLNVYGTNTELENLHFGPALAHNAYRLDFAFRCELCPGEYTLTVASHDPDGTWHDWLEDAVAFTVTDSRYTAGVANLRATVRLS